MSGPRASLSDLADILLWEKPSAAPGLWLGRYEDLLESRLQAVAAASVEDECILDSLTLLPIAQKRRFLHSHSVAAELLKPAFERSGGGWIAKALLAELAIAELIDELPEEVWTANGDRRLEPGARSNWKDPGPSVSGTGVLLDLCSPFDYGFGKTGALSHLDQKEWQRIQDELVQAASFLRENSESAYGFWKECVDVIAVRKITVSAKAFSSGSFGRHATLTVLGFSESERVDIALLADALLHEAIHSLLFMYEEFQGKFVVEEGSEGLSVQSPWTGNKLRLDTYVHACIVWYGLYWMWSRRTFSDRVSEQRQNEMRHRARIGFSARPVSSLLVSHIDFLSPPAIDLLQEIEDRMLIR